MSILVPVLLTAVLLLAAEIALLKTVFESWHLTRVIGGEIPILLVVLLASVLPYPWAHRFMVYVAWLMPLYACLMLGTYTVTQLSSKFSKKDSEAFSGAYTRGKNDPIDNWKPARDPSKPYLPTRREPPIDLFRNRTIIRINDINTFSITSFSTGCQAAMDECKPVTVEVHSHGGSVDEAWSMRERLRLLSEVCDVQVIVVGVCMSAGVSLITAVPIERRWATRDSEFMIHGGRVITDDSKVLASSELSSFQHHRLSEVNNHWVIGLLAGNTAIAEADLHKIIDAERDVYLSAEDGLELGIVGGIV